MFKTSKSNVTTTNTVTLPQWLDDTLHGQANRAESLSKTPFDAYGGQRVAGMNGTQTAAADTFRGLSGYQAPQNAAALTQGTNLSDYGAGRTLAGSDLSPYMNPYTQNVINTTMGEMQRQGRTQQQSIMGDAVMRGAFGGDRSGLMQTEAARNSEANMGNIAAQLYAQNFAQAQQGAQYDINNRNTLADKQAGYDTNTRQFNANSFNTVSQANQNAALQGATLQGNAASNLFNIGQQQQATDQASRDAEYEEFQRRINDPYAKLQFSSNIANGVTPAFAGSVSNTSQKQAAPFMQLLGMGVSALGGLGASGRLARGGRVFDAEYEDLPGYNQGGLMQLLPMGAAMAGMGGGPEAVLGGAASGNPAIGNALDMLGPDQAKAAQFDPVGRRLGDSSIPPEMNPTGGGGGSGSGDGGSLWGGGRVGYADGGAVDDGTEYGIPGFRGLAEALPELREFAQTPIGQAYLRQLQKPTAQDTLENSLRNAGDVEQHRQELRGLLDQFRRSPEESNRHAAALEKYWRENGRPEYVPPLPPRTNPPVPSQPVSPPPAPPRGRWWWQRANGGRIGYAPGGTIDDAELDRMIAALPAMPATRTASYLESGLGANTEHGGSFRGPLAVGDDMWRTYAPRLRLSSDQRDDPEAQRRIYESFTEDRRRANPRATDADVYTAWGAGPGMADAMARAPGSDAYQTYRLLAPGLADRAFSSNPGLLERGMTNAQSLAAYRNRYDTAANGPARGGVDASGRAVARAPLGTAPPRAGADPAPGGARPAAADDPDMAAFREMMLGNRQLANRMQEAELRESDRRAERTRQAPWLALMQFGAGLANSRDPSWTRNLSDGLQTGLASYMQLLQREDEQDGRAIDRTLKRAEFNNHATTAQAAMLRAMRTGEGRGSASGGRALTAEEYRANGLDPATTIATWNRHGELATEARPHTFEQEQTLRAAQVAPMEGAADKAVGEARGAQYLSLENLGQSIGEQEAQLTQARELLRRQPPLGAAADIRTTLGRWAAEVGIPNDLLAKYGIGSENIAAAEQLGALSGAMVLERLKSGEFPSANFSDADRRFLSGLGPDITRSEPGLKALFAIQEATIARQRQVAEAWQKFRAENPGLSVSETVSRFNAVRNQLIQRDRNYLANAYRGVMDAARANPTTGERVLNPGGGTTAPAAATPPGTATPAPALPATPPPDLAERMREATATVTRELTEAARRAGQQLPSPEQIRAEVIRRLRQHYSTLPAAGTP